jgi:hypothetical protein
LGDTVTLLLRGDWRKAKDDCCAEIIGTTPTNAAATALAATGIAGDRTRRVAQNLMTATNEESWGISLQADIELGEHVLTSITSYRGWDNQEIRDGDWLDQPYVGLNQLHDDGPQTSNTYVAGTADRIANRQLPRICAWRLLFQGGIGSHFRALGHHLFGFDIASSGTWSDALVRLPPAFRPLQRLTASPTSDRCSRISPFSGRRH